MIEHNMRMQSNQSRETASSLCERKIHTNDASLRVFREFLAMARGASSLDLSDTAGEVSDILRGEGFRVFISASNREVLQETRAYLTGKEFLVQNTAEVLPFASDSFDLVSCRGAASHSENLSSLLAEARRVMKKGGLFILSDMLTDPTPSLARDINALARFRDPCHAWAYSLPDWEVFFSAAGLMIDRTEIVSQRLNADDWGKKAGLSDRELVRLRVLLIKSPDILREALGVEEVGGTVFFTLNEVVFAGRKAQAS